jgi:thiamine-monophosphate kinase
MTRPGEDELIARYFGPLAGPGALELKDDTALITPVPGHDLVLTADAIVAGVHFLPDDPPDSIGRKALGVNLSDLAAKGADPLGFVLTLALPPDWTETWVAGFAAGLGGMARELGCPLLGGDTVRTPGPLSISVTAFGTVPEGRMVRRTTARPGDAICVTGTIGDAALGLALSLPTRPPGRRRCRERSGTFSWTGTATRSRGRFLRAPSASTRRPRWTCRTVSRAILPRCCGSAASPARSRSTASRSHPPRRLPSPPRRTSC